MPRAWSPTRPWTSFESSIGFARKHGSYKAAVRLQATEGVKTKQPRKPGPVNKPFAGVSRGVLVFSSLLLPWGGSRPFRPERDPQPYTRVGEQLLLGPCCDPCEVDVGPGTLAIVRADGVSHRWDAVNLRAQNPKR